MDASVIDIKITPWSGGRLRIFVDGEVWGSVHPIGHGKKGSSYFFRQEGGDSIRIPRKANRMSTFEIPGDALASWRSRGGPTIEPFGVRVVAAARYLIEQGLLRSPAIVQTERERITREAHAHEAVCSAQADAAFEDRAREALAFAGRDDQVAAVVEAMRWAQSQ